MTAVLRDDVMLTGRAGAIEVSLARPTASDAWAVALICHPHPLHGGTMENKVVQTLAKACVDAGVAAVRFNFRGAGRSEGVFDHGEGETDDADVVLQWARRQVRPGAPWIGAGFSFGAAVQARLADRLPAADRPAQLVLVGPAVGRFATPQPALPALVIHGETDDVVPLADVFAWARPSGQPVTVFPGCGHFFHGRLTELRSVVRSALIARLTDPTA